MHSVPESNTKYNGWTNYETWAVNLWIGNEQDSQRMWKAAAAHVWSNSTAEQHFSRSERACFDLADRLKAHHEAAAPDLGASVWADLLQAAVGEVNWEEIANGFLEGADGYDRQPDPRLTSDKVLDGVIGDLEGGG